MDDSWNTAAREMLSYFGPSAVTVAAQRADDMARRGDWRAVDLAMLLLNRVEHLSRARA
ncbi:MAG: hypothetical protein HY055_11820 [Magnetospirillum sp.]|nr:hypothetical protein [Magnetospirillum sp.]